MKKTYQIPALYQDNVLDGCQLLNYSVWGE